MDTWNTRNRGSHHPHRSGSRRGRTMERNAVYVRIAIPLLLLLLLARLAWRAEHSIGHPASSAASDYLGGPLAPIAPPDPPWHREFADTLTEAVSDAEAGNITAAEVAVDRGEAIVTAARLESSNAQPQFFTDAIAGLDQVMQQRPQDQHLFDHVAQARISLAEFRSSVQSGRSPENAPAAFPDAKLAQDVPRATGGNQDSQVSANASELKPVRIAAPRSIAAHETLDPRSLGGNYLDATLIPGTAEVLLAPASRSLEDSIRVENVTIAGAAQTLDGIHWRNVTFIATRLRYESGDLDLQNVRFVRCRFGFPTDARGVRLANAIALGQSSITIQ